MDLIGEHPDEMWDEDDGFFYDVLRLPDGTGARIKVRSLVGLLPLCATTVIEADALERFPQIAGEGPGLPGAQPGPAGQHRRPARARRAWPAAAVAGQRGQAAPHPGADAGRGALPGPARDPLDLALAPRASLQLHAGGADHQVQYEPAELTSGMFGGNSNWRGPVWFPINLLLIRALLQHYRYYGDDLKVECPTGRGR